MNHHTVEHGSDTAERMQQNVRNLPLASMALAGLLGAGAMALMTSLKSYQRNT